MRLLAIAVLALLVTSVSACRGSIDERANSQITVTNAATGALVGNGDTYNTVNLAPGETLQLKVMRRTDHSDGTFTDEDVTNQVSWDIKTAGVANISPAGLITASAPGNAEVQAEFNDGDSDTTDNDVARFFINVAVPTP
jgi:hypothetical protein